MRLSPDGIEVEPNVIVEAARQVQAEADATLSLASSLSGSMTPMESGSSALDANAAGLVGAWSAQLYLLAAVSSSLAMTLTATSAQYRDTDLAVAVSLLP